MMCVAVLCVSYALHARLSPSVVARASPAVVGMPQLRATARYGRSPRQNHPTVITVRAGLRPAGPAPARGGHVVPPVHARNGRDAVWPV